MSENYRWTQARCCCQSKRYEDWYLSLLGARVRENRSYNENACKGWFENWWRVISEVEATKGTVAIAQV